MACDVNRLVSIKGCGSVCGARCVSPLMTSAWIQWWGWLAGRRVGGGGWAVIGFPGRDHRGVEGVCVFCVCVYVCMCEETW